MESCVAAGPPRLSSGFLSFGSSPRGKCFASRFPVVPRLHCLRQNGEEFCKAKVSASNSVFSWKSDWRREEIRRRDLAVRAGREGDAAAAAATEQVDVKVVSRSEDESAATGEQDTAAAAPADGVQALYEKLGIDKDGTLKGGLPPEFLELMKDEGNPTNYWALGIGLVVIVLARKIIWEELKRWAKVAAALALGGVDIVIYGLARLIRLGGEPLASVIAAVVVVILAIRNILYFISEVVSPVPVLLSVSLASVVLLVGESVSDTYTSSQKGFPSRRTMDYAGYLGLGGLVGLLPGEVVLLGLAAITIFLLVAKKLKPVAAFTPAVGVMAAVSIPIVRYPILLAFAGPCLYRYWRLGYLSKGAVPKERTVEYPYVLKGLLYLAGISLASRTAFFAGRYIQAGIELARAA